jgi:hypothetical protein
VDGVVPDSRTESVLETVLLQVYVRKNSKNLIKLISFSSPKEFKVSYGVYSAFEIIQFLVELLKVDSKFF